MTERWLSVSGYEGHYEVSDLGRVRSIDRTILCKNGQRFQAGRVLKTFLADRYAAVNLCKNGEPRQTYVHLLVLIAFRGPRPEGTEGAHDDGDNLNNAARNLRWKTPSQNAEDRRRHGTMPCGEQHKNAKLTDAAVQEMRQSPETLTALARRYGVDVSTAHRARTGKGWKHVVRGL